MRRGVQPALDTHDLELDARAASTVRLDPPDVAVAGVQEVELACKRGGGGNTADEPPVRSGHITSARVSATTNSRFFLSHFLTKMDWTSLRMARRTW